MRIGVLQAGLVAEDLAADWGEYDRFFERLLGLTGADFEVRGWRVVDGEFPPRPEAADGWIISGSKHGVYEDHAFIPPLEAFIRAVVAAKRPLIGVCFGHQIMAQALGGKAEKSAKGWGLGLHEYALTARPGWMRDAPESLVLPAVHQDQVVMPPPEATRLATSPFCENALLAYGDPERPWAISIQPHPEFTAPFARTLIELRRGAPFPESRSDAALKTLAGEAPRHHGDWAAGWFRDFFEMHKK